MRSPLEMCAFYWSKDSFVNEELPNVILVPVNVSSHAEVSNFGHASWSFASQQAIPSRDVPERRETETMRSACALSALTDKTQ